MRRHGKLLVAAVSAFALLAIGTVAEAQTPQTVDHPGPGAGGTNPDGTCETLQEGDPAPSPGNIVWQFNLTPQQNPQGAVLDALFDDGTVVDDQPADRVQPSGVHFFFVETSAGASLIEASASFTGDDPPPSSRLVVSHCNVRENGKKPTTTTTTTVPDDTTTTTVPDDTTTTTVPDETTTTTRPTGPSAPTPAPAPRRAAPAQAVPAQPSFIG